MPLLWTEPDYLIALTLWLITLAAIMLAVLRLRQRWRRGKTLTNRRSVFLGVGLAVWSLLATITALEVFFVLFVDHSDAFNGTNVSRRWYRRYMDANHNADGFRDRRTLGEPLPPGVKRLVVFGDSYVAGHGVRNLDDRFTERLERDFNAGGVQRVWVSNLGEPGYEVSQIESLMQAVLKQGVPAEMFLYCYMLNDIEGYDRERTEAYLRKVNASAPTNPLITRTYFLNWVYFRWQQVFGDSVVNYFPNLEDAYSRPVWQSVAHSLERMQQRCQDAGIEFRMVIFPFMQNLGEGYTFRHVHQQLVDWANEHNVPVLDMEPLLSAHAYDNLHANAFDAHPNEYAHQLIADAIYNWLKNDPRLISPAGSKEPAKEAQPAGM